MEARRVAVQIAEATLSATNSSAVQRECRPRIVVGIIVIVVLGTTIIDTPNREEVWITQNGRKECPEK
jgi:hypothetical protein